MYASLRMTADRLTAHALPGRLLKQYVCLQMVGVPYWW